MISGLHRNPASLRCSNRSAFTLIELLVVITIMLVVFSLTAGVVTLAINTDRIPSSARTIQSAILGARDRAVRAGRDDVAQQPKRGVRFVLNPNIPNTVNSLVYIGSQDDWSGDGPTATPPSWVSVTHSSKGISFTPGLPSNLPDLTGSRIKILDPGGNWYRVEDATATLLTREYAGDPMDPNKNYGYRIELPPTILANEQPLPLDSNVVINLDFSEIPTGWNREILFSPNGSISGPMSASDPIYLYLCTVDDVLSQPPRGPSDPDRGEALVIKITPQTGQIQTFPVSPEPGKPFQFAKQ